MGQNLCTQLPANTENGAFEIEGNITSGCSPLTIKVKNKSGSNDVHYLFDYLDQSPAQLDWTGHRDSIDVGFANTTTQNYTILQYGKRNGKEFYACKTVVVRPNIRPVFSYNTCNNNFLNLIIPIDPKNNFDFYEIDFGDASPIIPVQKNQLPFSINKSYATSTPTRSIRVLGNNNIPTGCSPHPYQTVNMDSDGNLPKITAVEVLDGGKIAKLTFTGAFDKHQIYQRKLSESYSFPNFKVESLPGSLQLPIAGSESNCFMVYRNPACVQLSGEVCTIKLDSIIPVSITQNNVQWEGFSGVVNSSIIKSSQIQSVIDTLKIETFNNSNILTLSQIINLKPYPHFFSDCKLKYCYQIISTIKGEWGTFPPLPYESRSISEKKCLDRSVFKPPALDDINLDINENNQIMIDFLNNSGWQFPVSVFYLKNLDSLPYPAMDSVRSAPLHFEPKNLNPAKNEKCFGVQFKDVCGSLSEISTGVCNILLKETNSKQIDWNSAIPFGNSSITSYQLLEYQDNQNNIAKQYSFASTNKSSPINLDNFEFEAKYRLKATSATGRVSHSNILKIPIDPMFFFPDAISMDGNNFNDIFEIKGKFGRVSSSEFEIYDRWGAKIYSGNGKEWKPDENLPVGSYFYKIKFYLNGSAIQIKTGKIEIIK
ncbi:MAG: gliding motility-associated C-terminal domain-containing protein [Spirosomataceae bacterium]